MAGEAPGAVAPSKLPSNWRPQTAKEIAEEMARLRELAQRVRFQPATVKQFASEWLHSPEGELAALTRWHNGAHRKEPRGMLATDLQDAVRLVARATEQSKWQDGPEAFAKRLEHVAGSLGPRLREWMARSRVAAPGSIEAFRHYAECRYGDRLPEYATAELLADPINAALAAGDDIKQLTATQLMYREQEIGIYDYGGEYHKVDARRHCALRLLSRVVDDAAAAVVASGGDPASLYTAQQAAERGAAQFGKEWAPAVVTLRTAQAKLKAAAESPQGSAGTKNEAADGNATVPDNSGSHVMGMLLNAYTKGASSAKLAQMVNIIQGNDTVDEKTTKLNQVLSLGAISGEGIAELLGCTKQAIYRTAYWTENRKGERDEKAESRRAQLIKRGQTYERGRSTET